MGLCDAGVCEGTKPLDRRVSWPSSALHTFRFMGSASDSVSPPCATPSIRPNVVVVGPATSRDHLTDIMETLSNALLRDL